MTAVEERLRAAQQDLARAGFYSAGWRDGNTLHLIASTDAHWVDANMDGAAATTGALTWHWEPAQQQDRARQEASE